MSFKGCNGNRSWLKCSFHKVSSGRLFDDYFAMMSQHVIVYRIYSRWSQPLIWYWTEIVMVAASFKRYCIDFFSTFDEHFLFCRYSCNHIYCQIQLVSYKWCFSKFEEKKKWIQFNAFTYSKFDIVQKEERLKMKIHNFKMNPFTNKNWFILSTCMCSLPSSWIRNTWCASTAWNSSIFSGKFLSISYACSIDF